MRHIPLRQETVEMLARPIRGKGGFQSLMRRIQRGMEGRVLTVTQEDINALLQAVQGPSVGGFQRRARHIVVDAVMERWDREGCPRRGIPPPGKLLPFSRAHQRELPFGEGPADE